MRYFDKSKGRTVELQDSRREFLVLTGGDGARPESEHLRSVIAPRLFSVRYGANRDRVALLALRSDAESTQSVETALAELRGQPGVVAVAPAVVDESGQTRFVWPRRVNVQAARDVTGAVRQRLEELGARVSREFPRSRVLEVDLPPDADLSTFVDVLNADPRIVLVEPAFYGVDDQDVRVSATRGDGATTTDDALSAGGVPVAWNLAAIRAPQAWSNGQGTPDVVVAVLDGMPDTGHPALAGKFLLPADGSHVHSSETGFSSHATNVASVLAATGPVAGVAPGLRILPVVVNLASQLYAERAEAIHFVADCARSRSVGGLAISRIVMSCSWRTRGDVSVVRLALQDAVEAGVPVVFSAGNDGSSDPHYPSDYAGLAEAPGDGLLSVGALARDDRRAPYSNHSGNLSLSAPGGDGLPIDERDILCADLAGSLAFAAGTSIAVPHVAAAAALMLSADRTLTPSRVKQLLRRTARDVSAANPDDAALLGAGCLDASAAVSAVLLATPQPVPVPTADDTPAVPVEAPPTPQAPAIVVSSAMEAPVRQLVVERLRACRAELLTATGWSLDEALLEAGARNVTVDIRPAE